MDGQTITTFRPVAKLARGMPASDGAGVKLNRVIGTPELQDIDPFLMLDEFRSDDAADYLAGFPDHPHRGFETVTYMLAGRMRHGDNKGHTGLLEAGSVQWMTAGRGIIHSEMPEQENGLMQGFQLWVNLPAKDKMTAPRYQSLEAAQVQLLASPDGGALVRIIAGDVAGHRGPGDTHTPIAFVHASVAPGARLRLPWRPDFNALVYVLGGSGRVGSTNEAVTGGQLVVFGAGDYLDLAAADRQDGSRQQLEVVILGGRPIREPVAWYGPFVMNTKAELAQAMDDYRAGKLGVIPPGALMPHVVH